MSRLRPVEASEVEGVVGETLASVPINIFKAMAKLGALYTYTKVGVGVLVFLLYMLDFRFWAHPVASGCAYAVAGAGIFLMCVFGFKSAPYLPLALLYVIYFVAICVGAVISNNAVVVLMFPIVVRVCEGAGTSWKAPFYALLTLTLPHP